MIKEKLKELGKALLACLAIMTMVFIPVIPSLGIYYLSSLLNINFSVDLMSFFNGSVCGSVFMLMFLLWLIISKKMRFEENAEDTEQEN